MLPINLLMTIIVMIGLTILLIVGDFKGAKEQVKCRFVSLLLLPFLLINPSNSKNYNLNESTFFLVMTNIQYYPEEYTNKDISLDCFTYKFQDVEGKDYLCGVRKCTSGFGCKCGRDTVIGFILNYDGEIPEPKNQYEATNDKSWIHITGQLQSQYKTSIKIYAYESDGSTSNKTEIVQFLTFNVQTLTMITDYENLAYFVSN